MGNKAHRAVPPDSARRIAQVCFDLIDSRSAASRGKSA
jgi:hypothetical protein